jgi:hypothetical protein
MYIANRKMLVCSLSFIYICLVGCNPQTAPPSIISPKVVVEEYPLKGAPDLEPLSFIPVEGTQEGILAKHQKERGNTYPANSPFFAGQSGVPVQLGNDTLTAEEIFSDAVLGEMQKVTVHVLRNGIVIYSIPAGVGSPVNTIRGLWTYATHWALEIANVNETLAADNSIAMDVTGQIIQDGELLNERYGYEEAFGFQLLQGKPFYYFKREGRIDYSYNGKEFPLGYTNIHHYGCCSAGAANPKVFPDLVAFFAQRGEKWFYVEMGVYE